MKLRYLGIPLFIGMVILGIFYMKYRLKAETNRMREEREYQGISLDSEVVQDVELIRLISDKGILSSDITAQDIFDLEAFVSQDGQAVVSGYVEVYYRVSKALNKQCMQYRIQETDFTSEKVKNAYPGIYVEVIYRNPHTFRFKQKDWIMEDIRHFLYNVEDGTLWYGNEPNTFTHCAVYAGGDIPFQLDGDFIRLVEGDF